jgi:hypothetical protein
MSLWLCQSQMRECEVKGHSDKASHHVLNKEIKGSNNFCPAENFEETETGPTKFPRIRRCLKSVTPL